MGVGNGWVLVHWWYVGLPLPPVDVVEEGASAFVCGGFLCSAFLCCDLVCSAFCALLEVAETSAGAGHQSIRCSKALYLTGSFLAKLTISM